MASEYLLPGVSNKTTSPLASRRSNVTDKDATKTSSTLNLPSLKSNTSRVSIGSTNGSVRYPLSNIQMDNLVSTHRVDMDIDSNESIKKISINSNDEAKPYSLDTPEAMQVDKSVHNINEKSMDLCYPSQSKFPPRSLVQALYDEAVSLNANEVDASDQLELRDAGLLSLEQVLLPAVAYQEEQMLKEWQSIVQRDGSSHQKATVIALRKTVYSGIGAACAAVRKSRQSRAIKDREREIIWKKEAEERQAAELEKQQKNQEIIDNEYREALRQRQRNLQKKLPANQEVWREVAYLMTELTKLSNEERQWRNVATQFLDRTEADLVEHEKQLKDTQYTLEFSKRDAEINIPSEAVLQMVDTMTDTATDITLAVDRIRNALRHVSNTVVECEQSRQQLYQQYVSNHQFYGYQGVHDPKGLLKVLSQSQSED